MPEPIEELRRQRLQKLEKIKTLGVNPYPHRYDRRQRISEVRKLKLGAKVKIAGRLVSWREHGKLIFSDLTDASGKIQLAFRSPELSTLNSELLTLLDIGDFLGVEGKLFRTKMGELTVEVSSFVLLSKSLRPLPEKWEGLKNPDLRYRKRYLDFLSNPSSRESVIIRAEVIREIRAFFEEKEFLEVETPILQPVYGGASARPFETHYHALDAKFYLRIADELYLKRLIIGGFEKVFEIGKDFRNEGIDRSHAPEFTQMECYAAYADLYDMMDLAEGLFRHLAKKVGGKLKISYQGKGLDFGKKWKILTFAQAPKDAEGDIVNEKIWDPTFVVDWPRGTTPLAKPHRGKPGLSERFEPYAGGLELGNAYTELNDPLLQKEMFEKELEKEKRKEKHPQTHPMDEEFVEALEYGMPPLGGLGLGVDRIAMIFSDQKNIREVIPFPTLRPHQ